MLTVYDVHSLPLGSVGSDFSFIEDETQRHFADQEWSSPAWGFGVRLTTSHCKNHLRSETSHRYLEEIGINAGNWVDLAQDRNYWGALVNAALNLRVP